MHVKGFSLIELIFALLIIGVITSFAISKLGNTISSSAMLKLKSDLLLIQNGISNTLDKQLLNNQSKNLDTLDSDFDNLFSNILQKPIKSSNEKYSWEKIEQNKYIFNLGDSFLEFEYDNELFTFICDTSNEVCKKVIQ
jgi:general secretion pathway protein G